MLRAIHRNDARPSPFLRSMLLHDESRALIHIPPDNQPPPDGGYACFVAYRDVWQSAPGHRAPDGMPLFAASLEPAVIADLRGGRALLVLDLANEGPEFIASLFDAVHALLDTNDIPARRTIWLSQNRAIERFYLAAYRDRRAGLVRFEHYDSFVKLIATWFANPAWRGKVVGGDAAYVAALQDPARKRRLALCLNAAPRLHRVWTVAALHHFRVLDRCLVSFGGFSGATGGLDPARAVSALEGWQLHFLRRACAEVAAMGQLRVDTDFADPGWQLIGRIDIDTYLQTFFSIVTETDFSDGQIDRITEKTAKVFCLGHPAIVVGNPGAIRFATGLGFQDFAPALPSDYDCTSEPRMRLAAVFAEILAQIVAIQTNPAQWLGRMSEVSRFNFAHAAGGGLLRVYMDRHDKRVVAALERRLAGGME